MENEIDTQESLNPDGESETEITDEESETSTDEVAAKLKKTEEYARNQKIRAEKAEQELKKLKVQPEKETPKNSTTEFSPKDYLALSQAGVPADDLDEVMDYAKFKGISIHEALKSSYIKTTLKEKAEERKSAETAATGAARKPSSKATGEALLEKLERNELPASDIEAAVKARIAQRQNRT